MSSRRVALTALSSLAVLGALGTLGGCGFELRRPPRLRFASIALQGFEPRSPLALALQRQLALQVHVLPSPERADVVLQVLEETRGKSVAATTAAAQVREFTLWLRFAFRATTPGGRELIPRSVLGLSSDLSYSENFALAKQQEEAQLYEDMDADIVSQVLRRLASIRL